MNLMELPMELVVEIMKRLPAKWVCRIRCVCKMLLSIVDSPSFVMLHSKLVLDPDSHLPPASEAFILQHCRSYSSPKKLYVSTLQLFHYDPNSDARSTQLNARHNLQSSINAADDYDVEFVFCNLFCITYRVGEISFVVNPLRGEVLRLPPSHHLQIAKQVSGLKLFEGYVSIGMGFDSITNTYKILRVAEICILEGEGWDTIKRYCYESLVLVLGTSQWRQVPAAPPPDTLLHRYKNICAHGDMHWLVYDYNREGIQDRTHILSFDFKKEDFFWTPNPYILPDVAAHSGQLHLITFRGSMAIVDTTSRTNIEIWVMKDYTNKQWMLDYSINIRMLELDHPFAFGIALCCEWEHGIVFKVSNTLFLDTRGAIITKKLLKCSSEGETEGIRIMSISESLISLKSYGNLGEAEEPATYSNWSEAKANRKVFFYLTR